VSSLAPAFNAPAFDIQDDLGLAVLAIHRQPPGVGIGLHPQQPFIPPADRALHPTIRCHYYTTAVHMGQHLSFAFVLASQYLYTVSRTNNKGFV
jgi:hypothetical protein